MRAFVWAACVVCIALANYSAADDKIPVTTTSDQARELYLQGRALVEKFRNTEARMLFEQAVALDPGFALAHRDLATVQPTAKLFRESIIRAEALVDRVSECERCLILSLDAGAQLKTKEQRAFLGQLVGACGKDARSHVELGTFYYGQQHWDSAATELQRAVELNPNYLPAWNMLGYSYRFAGDFAQSASAYEKYIELSPNDANPYDSYAELLLSEGKFEESIARYRQALAVDSTFSASRSGQAAPLVYLGRHADARRELYSLLSRARDDGERQTAHFNIAWTYADEGKLDEALAAVDKVTAIAEKNSDVTQTSQNAALVGFVRLEQGRYDEALAQYQRSRDLAANSDLPQTLKDFMECNLIYAQARMASANGETARAHELAESFATKAQATGNQNALFIMHQLNGILAMDEKQYAKAVDEFKLANPLNGDNRFRLAMAYEGMGERQKALEHMRAAAHMNTLLNLNDVLNRQKALQLTEQWSH